MILSLKCSILKIQTLTVRLGEQYQRTLISVKEPGDPKIRSQLLSFTIKLLKCCYCKHLIPKQNTKLLRT